METNIPKPSDFVASSFDENIVTELLAQNLTFCTELKNECWTFCYKLDKKKHVVSNIRFVS